MAAGPTYEPIATTTLGSAASSITFSSITSAYTDLKAVLVFTPTASLRCRVDVNSDTATNYSSTLIIGDGTTASSTRYSTASWVNVINANNSTIAFLELDVFSYSGSTYKTLLSSYSQDDNGGGRLSKGVALWRNTAAINTIRFFASSSTFAAGTTATLYGIKNA